MKNYINGRPIPDQDEIENEFGMHDYAYLMVSYLIDNFIELLKDKKVEPYLNRRMIIAS